MSSGEGNFLNLLLALDTSVEAADPLDKSLVLSLNFTDGALFWRRASCLRSATEWKPSRRLQRARSQRRNNRLRIFIRRPAGIVFETYENGSIEAETFFEENTRFQLVVGVGEKPVP